MGKYSRLTLGERYQIAALRRSGMAFRQIGRQLNRNASTVLRELKRNGIEGGGYRALTADVFTGYRRRKVHPPFKITGALESKVREHIHSQWSPEQIAGRLDRSGTRVSSETIYKFIYRDAQIGGLLWTNLRRHRSRRRSHQVTKNFKKSGQRTDKTWIDDRPAIVERRIRLGDIERDIVLGKERMKGPALLTCVDRVSKRTWIAKVEKVSAVLVHQATVEVLKRTPVHTITNDNGNEFSLDKKTTETLGAPVYFNHPYSSWQRGTNENTNGLIRQYFPKGYNFRNTTEADIRKIEILLNHRPRKRLGYRTPIEVHNRSSRMLR